MTGGEVSEALAAFVRHPGEGEARWWLGSLSVILASSRETGGKFTLIDVTDPECETPLHVHHREDETFIVLDGEIEFNIGGKEFKPGRERPCSDLRVCPTPTSCERDRRGCCFCSRQGGSKIW